jgi:protein tyrosine/serine phosphatase
MELTKLPFLLPGQIYRSVMPFSSYDPNGELIQAYKKLGITLIVMLTSDEECLRITGHDLKSVYKQEDFKVLNMPIPDFGTPTDEDFEQAVSVVSEYVRIGGKVVIHCLAGKGRTGMFAACLAKREMDCSSEEAISWVREFIPGAVEVPEQEQFVRSFKAQESV